MIEKHRLISCLSELISYRTLENHPDEIERCFEYIQQELNFSGLTSHIYNAPVNSRFKSHIQSRVWCTHPTEQPDIILYAHIDVVSAADTMFSMKVENDIAVGRGVFDMKFAIPAYIEVLRAMTEHGVLPASLGVMIVSDEEVGGFDGVKYLLEKEGYRPKVVIMPDGGPNWHIVEDAKGVLRVTIETSGKTSHASRPWNGISAIDQIVQIASALRQHYPEPTKETWSTTINLSEILGGQNTDKNQVADKASLYLDIRFPSSESPDQILKTIQEIAAEVSPSTVVKTLILKSSFHADRNNPYIQLWKNLITNKSDGEVFIKEAGTADHQHFSEYGIPVIVSAPVGGDIHSDTEWIDLESLVEYSQALYDFLLKASKLSSPVK